MTPHLRFSLAIVCALLATSALGIDHQPAEPDSFSPGFLAAMNEPSMAGIHMDKITETYRFTWLRTFHKPIAIRIWKNRSEVTLRIVRLSGKSGYQIGRIERDESFALTPAQWDEFLKLRDEGAFWDTPSSNREVAFADGSQWLLEGKVADKYHLVSRSCPLEDTGKRHLESFVASCRYLLKLSREEIPPKADY